MAWGVAVALTAAAGTGARAAEGPAPVDDPVAYVDPRIGTAGAGFTVPGAATPFGLTQVSPDTTGPFAYTGYAYTDARIRGFSMLHISGAGVPIGADLPFMPVVGPVTGTDPSQYAVGFSPGTEEVSAGRYAVTLASGVRVELAATPHGGLQRYAAPAGAAFSVIADVGRNAAGLNTSTVEAVGSDGLAGSSLVRWRGGDYRAHFTARFSRPFDSARTFVGSAVSPSRSASGTGAGAVLSFPAGEPVTMAVGVSLVDLDGARRNLSAELTGTDVATAQAAARAAWRRELSRVRVFGGSTAQRRTFYTALYHTMLHPDVDSDVDGRYLGADGAVHAVPPGRRHYGDFSLWDTIRGQNALLATLFPDRYADMVWSLSAFADQTPDGRLPRWSLHSARPDYMNGDPAVPTIAEAICRDLPGLDVQHLYAQMRRLTDLRPADDLRRGWRANDAAGTLEDANADAALALVADRLGKPDDAALLAQRSLAWRNLFRDGFLQPRAADGSFDPAYDPRRDTGYREGTGYQYRWLVPHDEGGLTAALGGRDAATKALDALFSVPASTAVPGTPLVPQAQSSLTVFGTVYYGDQYVPGNEHDLEAPYVYAWTGRPSTSQAVISSLRSLFYDNPFGLPGNDDLGSLSAWYVWAALGLYPVVPGAPLLVVGTPMFPRVQIDVGGRRPFVVDAPGAAPQTPYIAAARLDGRPFDRTWLPAAALRPGGRLQLAMTGAPTSWASAPQAAPPSFSTGDRTAFGCSRSADQPDRNEGPS